MPAQFGICYSESIWRSASTGAFSATRPRPAVQQRRSLCRTSMAPAQKSQSEIDVGVNHELIAASSGVLLIFRQRLSVSRHSEPVSLSTTTSLQRFSRSVSLAQQKISTAGEVPQQRPARRGTPCNPFPHPAHLSSPSRESGGPVPTPGR